LKFLKKGKTAFFVKITKKNFIRMGILSCAFLVSFLNLRFKRKDILEGSLFFSENSIGPVEELPEKSKSLVLAPILDVGGLADYEQFLKEEGEKRTVVSALMPVTNPTVEEFVDSAKDVYIYKVELGDTVSSIALKYEITQNTIYWANDLTEDSIIKPGDSIFILPITGVRHKVKDGDTVQSLAKKYEAKEEKIISFNDLSADGELKVGEEIIIPDGKQEDKPRYRNVEADQYVRQTGGDNAFLNRLPAHRFPYGWCTWYVASRRNIPWGGNAGTWLYHARAYGAATGKTPQKGAIIVTRESIYGHVGIVEKVNGNQITISEMNYVGWGIESSRTISTSNPVIMGYIY
jgi:surface antigen/Mor family transcriptional regulator